MDNMSIRELPPRLEGVLVLRYYELVQYGGDRFFRENTNSYTERKGQFKAVLANLLVLLNFVDSFMQLPTILSTLY